MHVSIKVDIKEAGRGAGPNPLKSRVLRKGAAMLEINPLRNILADLQQRTDVLRGYL